MNKELKERLSQLESYLNTAVYCDYIRQISRTDLLILVNAYKEIFGVNFTESLNCGNCVLGLVKRIGIEYFAYVEPEVIKEPIIITKTTKKGVK